MVSAWLPCPTEGGGFASTWASKNRESQSLIAASSRPINISKTTEEAAGTVATPFTQYTSLVNKLPSAKTLWLLSKLFANDACEAFEEELKVEFCRRSGARSS
jgi:hypothetical protein